MSSKKTSSKSGKKIAARKKRNRVIILVLEMILILCLACVSYVVSLMDLIQQENRDVSFYVRQKTSQAVEQSTDKETSKAQEETRETESQTILAEETEEQTEAPINYTGETTYTTVLLVGVDARLGDGLTTNTRSDTVIVCAINDQTKQVRLASLYRDTYLRWSNGSYGKLTEQMQKGDIVDLVNSINYDFDLAIDSYVVVNWSIAANIVNMLGGIDIELTEEEVGANNPTANINGYITTIVENTGIPSTGIYEAGMRTLDGVQAVAYCRIRYVGNDYERTVRQQKTIDATLAKAKTAGIPTLIKIATMSLANIATNMDKFDILSMAMDVGKYSIEKTNGFPTEEGRYSDAKYTGHIPFPDCIVTDDFEGEVKKLHEFLYDDINYVVPDDVKEIGAYIRDMAEIY